MQDAEISPKPKRAYNRPMTPALREHLREIGRKGGSCKGEAKRRGDAAHYSKLAAMVRKPGDDAP